MLQNIRENSSGWVAKLLLAAIIVVMAFFGFSDYLSPKIENYAAKVVLPGKFLGYGEKTIEITTQIEQILLEKYPEVSQVVSRIGAAEIPTDPMSMEESDVIIKLKPKGEWTSAKTKDELADQFKESLQVIPGIDIEFTQPIEMRFTQNNFQQVLGLG